MCSAPAEPCFNFSVSGSPQTQSASSQISMGTSVYDEKTLIASPSYPNSICWSDENLLAVASGKLVTILSPASFTGPRGTITLTQNKPFPIGTVSREELLTPCLMPICLSRNTDPCVRSISWSPAGFSPSGGCLLSVCTADGHVKLYRSPYMEFTSEWIEIANVSQLLYEYHESTEFAQAESNNVPVHQADEVELGGGLTNGKRMPRKRNAKRLRSDESNSGYFHVNTPEQYASRSSILSSLVVAWSPMLPHSKSLESSTKHTILAVGAKSGEVSFWRICAPEQYSVTSCLPSTNVELVESLKAHDSWVSTISWGQPKASSCDSRLILATGSSDGSVKLWSADLEELIQGTKANKKSFCLLMEVTTNGSGPVSTISLIMPEKSQNKAVMGIGRGSGSVEVWTYDISSNQLTNSGTYHSHSQMVMGLAFSFDGRSLYSCSQDNSVCRWVFDGSRLQETNFPSDIPGNRNLAKLSHVSDLCYGIAVSPGEMMVAVVRNLEAKLLNPMYQAGTQKAMVELLYGGEQNLEIMKEPLDFSDTNFTSWKSNILCSLKKYENDNKDLVIWDIIIVLLTLRKSNPGLADNLLSEWFSGCFSDIQQVAPLENLLSHMVPRVSSMDTRKLHLICVICRKVIFIDSKSDNERQIWQDLLVACEKELRERLIGFTFTLVLWASSSRLGSMVRELGRMGQMVQWVSASPEASDWLKKLLSKIKKLKGRSKLSCQNSTEEKCSFCSAPVPFESPEVAMCNGTDIIGGSSETHKLSRCAVSMQLCSIAHPVWFCICCQRSVDKLPPQSFFSITKSPLDESCENVSLDFEEVNLPRCPFCGIMLQRQLPEFLLSINPV